MVTTTLKIILLHRGRKHAFKKKKWTKNDLTNAQKEKQNWNEDWNRVVKITSGTVTEQQFDVNVVVILFHKPYLGRKAIPF